MKIKSVITCWF